LGLNFSPILSPWGLGDSGVGSLDFDLASHSAGVLHALGLLALSGGAPGLFGWNTRFRLDVGVGLGSEIGFFKVGGLKFGGRGIALYLWGTAETEDGDSSLGSFTAANQL